MFKVGDRVRFVTTEPEYSALYDKGTCVVIDVPYTNREDGKMVVDIRYVERGGDLLQIVSVNDIELVS